MEYGNYFGRKADVEVGMARTRPFLVYAEKGAVFKRTSISAQ